MIEFWIKNSKKNERFWFFYKNKTYIDKLIKFNNCLLNNCSKCCLAFENFKALIMYFVININNERICDHSIKLFNDDSNLEACFNFQKWLTIFLICFHIMLYVLQFNLIHLWYFSHFFLWDWYRFLILFQVNIEDSEEDCETEALIMMTVDSLFWRIIVVESANEIWMTAHAAAWSAISLSLYYIFMSFFR